MVRNRYSQTSEHIICCLDKSLITKLKMYTKNHTTHKNINTKIHKAHIIQNKKSLCGLYSKQHKENKTPTSETRQATNGKDRPNFKPNMRHKNKNHIAKPASKQVYVVNKMTKNSSK